MPCVVETVALAEAPARPAAPRTVRQRLPLKGRKKEEARTSAAARGARFRKLAATPWAHKGLIVLSSCEHNGSK